ncbi:MAG: hypothetical protein CO096_03665 [Armatimonadetes bacterium CG_4_9_14_3_um_filter_66_14]|nr:MAG: hypothetical protein COZ57_26285 [Armatimonadetes bacterium CG_4_8_14_3_um_filter_66_20]PJB74429.1 MAG: hypothetical protein CO096_03665 [Armatimonadetes bacterium CG_4_9_14_3_um_filter_66_14]
MPGLLSTSTAPPPRSSLVMVPSGPACWGKTFPRSIHPAPTTHPAITRNTTNFPALVRPGCSLVATEAPPIWDCRLRVADWQAAPPTESIADPGWPFESRTAVPSLPVTVSRGRRSPDRYNARRRAEGSAHAYIPQGNVNSAWNYRAHQPRLRGTADMSRLGIGMIGGGAISNAHLAAVAASDKAELVCVADLNASTAEEKAEKFGAKSFATDYRELLAREDVDAVIIGIPAGLHAEAALAAFQTGKHVLVEKPMARTLAECDAMIGAAEQAGKVLQVAMVRRFDADWGKVRELVQAGKVGRPCLWRRMAQGSAPQPPHGAWYSDASLSDGPLAESGAHDFDFVRYTFGDVRAVTATNWQMGRVGSVLDTGIVTLDFESGDRMLCVWSWGLPPKCGGGTLSGMDVLGPDGALQQSRHRDDGRYECVVNGPDGAQEVFDFDNPRAGDYWFSGQFDNFVESVHGRQTPRATGLDGRKAQEIALAAFESSRTGRRVELPL